jgi:hypothetical protein
MVSVTSPINIPSLSAGHRLRPRARMRALSTARQPILARYAVVILIIAVASGPGLLSLFSASSQRGPLVVLAAVPVLAVLAAAALLSRPARGPNIHDRQLDFILAGMATVAAFLLDLLAAFGGDGKHGRLDLLAVPLTAIAAAVMLLGTRVFWRVWPAAALLGLLWPPPWEAILRTVDAHSGQLEMFIGQRGANFGTVGWLGNPLTPIFAGLLMGLTATVATGGQRHVRLTLSLAVAVLATAAVAILNHLASTHFGDGSSTGIAAGARLAVSLGILAVVNVAIARWRQAPSLVTKPRTPGHASSVASSVKIAVPMARSALIPLATLTAVLLVLQLIAASHGHFSTLNPENAAAKAHVFSTRR